MDAPSDILEPVVVTCYPVPDSCERCPCVDSCKIGKDVHGGGSDVVPGSQSDNCQTRSQHRKDRRQQQAGYARLLIEMEHDSGGLGSSAESLSWWMSQR